MKKVSSLYVVTLLVTVWMAGSWLFLNSLAIGAPEPDTSTPAAVTHQKAKSPDLAKDREFCNFKHRHGKGKFLEKLGLTDAQKSQVSSIRDEERANIKPLVQKLREGRKELRELTKSGQFDEARVRAIAKAQADTITDLIVAKQRMRSKIYVVLTPEQRAKAEKMRESWKAEHKGLNEHD